MIMFPMSKTLLDRIIIVLCRPEGSLNIGAVCRAMENMGISHLSLVGDLKAVDHEKVRMMAIHSYWIYENAGHFETLPEALSNAVIASGITRRLGKNRKHISRLPEELASFASDTAEGDIALVFGNEKSGLNDEELAFCTEACHIPSHPDNPSLNLSHAVQILTYSFYRETMQNNTGRYSPVPIATIETLADTVESTLKDSGYYDKPDRFKTRQFFRDIFARASLSKKEADHMEKVFQKLRSLAKSNREKQ
ncbi:RNA methyltransferase [Oceanispirochaeta sp. M1]|nr:RNA methyltransferase [Oceanispirochaeta sp. M1]